jgi:Protein of unknown function (DUF2721)
MEATDLNFADVAHVIQLAVAPVFLLSGVGITLTVLTNRLARVVDRARQVETAAKGCAPTELPQHQENLRVLARRAHLMNRSITLCTICALLVCLVVVALFVNAFAKVDLSVAIALLFVVAMLSFIVALLIFLREVFLATSSIRFGAQR